jgi:hypothetical protein
LSAKTDILGDLRHFLLHERQSLHLTTGGSLGFLCFVAIHWRWPTICTALEREDVRIMHYRNVEAAWIRPNSRNCPSAHPRWDGEGQARPPPWNCGVLCTAAC